jgi:hypothetical protein
VTYGQYVDDARLALLEAAQTAVTSRADSHRQVADALAWRNRVLHELDRLVELIATGARPAPVGQPVADDAMTLRRSLRWARTAAGRTEPGRPFALSDQLGVAAEALSVAGDILASHVDPINGPRSTEGLQIARGAGRPEAIVEVAQLVMTLATVDRRLVVWIGGDEPALPSPAAKHVRALRIISGWLATVGRVAGIASRTTSSKRCLVRDLVVAPGERDPVLISAPVAPADCVSVLDDLHLWLIRHPDQVEAHHLAAATRLGLLVATAARRSRCISAAEAAGWRTAIQAFGRIAAPPPPVPDEQLTRLDQAAIALRSDRPDDQTLTALTDRLPILAGAVRTALKRALKRGVMFTQDKALDSRTRTAIHHVITMWTRADPTDLGISNLLVGLNTAIGAAGRRSDGVFPPLVRVSPAGNTLAPASPSTTASARTWSR